MDRPSESGASYFESVISKPPPLEAATPQTNSTYREKTTRGGLFTLIVSLVVAALVWTECRAYFWGEPSYEFSVEREIAHDLQLNFDATVATPCHYLTVDVRDAVGDRLHISDEFKKDGTTFDIGHARSLKSAHDGQGVSASKMVRDAKGRRVFAKTGNVVDDGPACRIYGSMEVKKVTGNLHITTLGHGYLSWEHTDHALMNLSHVIHEFSFGPYFPRIVQPLDNSVEITNAHFHIFQYFLSVVSTTYVNAARRVLRTNQYSVTEMSRTTEHGKGVPGIFFKFDVEPMSLTVRERTTGLVQFLVRLAGIVGGILVCSDFGFRTADFFVERLMATSAPKTPLPVNTGTFGAHSGAPKTPVLGGGFASGFGRD
ncbi:endoplasmic reticulum vesicle transporter-domain-containing protein [Rhodotorula diobovata]|uniref:Endoplasmic reticulum vesicle transporter-domain-containing protein n=1 Tax=Rhodotorula diobovata TaxID=5288 RepID=A0A5C5FKB6_9BASI|nr:endoplasmic reticulum vesicle transporter-domain-containing protein [Rhodotorula diobovata]